jgi:CBS domain-containing protein/sporulation protein YlmC with PRC-barrel domain
VAAVERPGGTLIYVSRLVRLPLLDSEGTALGRVADVVLGPPSGGDTPRVIGFVAVVQRRRIFVNANRVGRIDTSGVELRSGTVDLQHFHARPAELLVHQQLLDRQFDSEVVNDVALRPCPGRAWDWECAAVSLRPLRSLRRRARSRVVPWTAVRLLFDFGPMGEEVGATRDLHPADLAAALRAMPLERRRRLASALEDDRLADVLEEMSEEDQLRLVEGLDSERLADVLEEMAPDDAADLLGEMPAPMRVQVLDAMEPDEAGSVRRLLLYESNSAGGLMTPQPVVMPADSTVAAALARCRDPDITPALAAQVFVTRLPVSTPTGQYLGAVGFQRLLREPPGMSLDRCVEPDIRAIKPDLPEIQVAEQLAAYNLLALPVCDDAGRLLGAVTVDDVLDRTLPEDWRGKRG